MIRNVLFASLIALGAAATGAAQAQAPDPTGRVPTMGNVVGGGAATIAGGGDNMQITYATGAAGGGLVPLAQPPRLARARNSTGSGSMSVEYLEPETARPGREAWLVGAATTPRWSIAVPADARAGRPGRAWQPDRVPGTGCLTGVVVERRRRHGA